MSPRTAYRRAGETERALMGKGLGWTHVLLVPVRFRVAVTGYHVRESHFELDTVGNLFLDAGYAWDGATGARDTGTNALPSAAHDALCMAVRKNRLPVFERMAIHREYLRLCLRDGMARWRAWIEFAGVCIGGLRDVRPYRAPEPVVVP